MKCKLPQTVLLTVYCMYVCVYCMYCMCVRKNCWWALVVACLSCHFVVCLFTNPGASSGDCQQPEACCGRGLAL